jgi:hypothetical protein
MEVLRDCAAPGAYRYAAVQRKEESSSLKDEDELYAKIPLGAAQLVGELKSHGAPRAHHDHRRQLRVVIREPAASPAHRRL